MGVMARVWDWAKKRASGLSGRGGGGGGGDRNARAANLRPYLAGGTLGWWTSPHDAESLKYTGWTYCAVSAMADQAAKATCRVYLTGRSRDPEGRIRKSAGSATDSADSDRIPVRPTHPMARLLERPNPEESGSDFRYGVILQLCLTGTAHVWIVRDREGEGAPVELYVVPTGATTPMPPSSEHPRGQLRVAPLSSFAVGGTDDYFPGSLGSLMTAGGYLDARDVKSIRLRHPLYLSDGWSPLAAGATLIDVETSLNQARWYSFKNSATPGLVMEVAEDADPSPEELEAFSAFMKARNGGVANVGANLMLPKGVTAKQLAASNKEMDYVSSYPQVRDSVLALHKTPAVAIGVSEAGSYAAYYAALKQFTELSVQPRLDQVADALTEALAPAFEESTRMPEGERLVIELKASGIDDPALREAGLRLLISGKSITINELRAKEGLPPVEWGDCPAGTDPIQWKQGLLQLKQAEQEAEQGGAPGGAPGGGDPLAALLGGGGPGGAGGSGPSEGSPAPQEGAPQGQGQGDDDPFGGMFGSAAIGDTPRDGGETAIGDISAGGGGEDAELPIGDISGESGPGLADPVRRSAPKMVKRFRLRVTVGRE